ncbi:MAG: RluA family pseudouridine synthase [Treponema sp.]|jgi:23S rRNA pseudouridine1911/1915/1917 synthase|nr:RluA family pseudouridine synthase [Treponema sp.]
MNSYSGKANNDIPASLRLDRYVSEYLKLLNRSQVKSRNLTAEINGKSVKLSRIVKPGDLIHVTWDEFVETDLIPEDLPLNIIFENERVVVIDKDQGMVVHPGAGNSHGTLANALYFRRLQKCGEGQSVRSGLRPGIVHRLDKDTSGVIIAAYDDEALDYLARQFKQRKTLKTYAAIIKGHLPCQKGKIETYISRDLRDRKKFAVHESKGKYALTYYKVIREWKGYSLVLLRPKTGRTHQLRVHLKHLGHPILGDPLYGGNDSHFADLTLMLHAKRLSIALPPDGLRMTFKSPLPKRFRALMLKLEKNA